MRRKKNEISQEAAKQLLQQERRGVFAVNGVVQLSETSIGVTLPKKSNIEGVK